MKSRGGFTLIEAIVGLLVSSLVLAASFALWSTHQTEGAQLAKKIDLRNRLTLASKRIQRSVTLAGIGLAGAPGISKSDAVGSDTLDIYVNPDERFSLLAYDADHHAPYVQVQDPDLFASGGYIAVSGGGHAELRRVLHISGSALLIDAPFAFDYPAAGSRAMPARRERYFSDQNLAELIRESGESRSVVAMDVKNFQVAFVDRNGASTSDAGMIRTVRFSLTGIYPARQGALNNLEFSSTAIPRNLL